MKPLKTSTFTQKPHQPLSQGTRICCQGGGSPNNSRISGAKICRLKPRCWTRFGIGNHQLVGWRWWRSSWRRAWEHGRVFFVGTSWFIFWFVDFVVCFWGWGCGWLVVFLNTSCCFEESGGMGSFEVGKMWTKSLHVKEKYICHIHRNIYIYALYTQYWNISTNTSIYKVYLSIHIHVFTN